MEMQCQSGSRGSYRLRPLASSQKMTVDVQSLLQGLLYGLFRRPDLERPDLQRQQKRLARAREAPPGLFLIEGPHGS